MKFTVVLKSHESIDYSYGLVFTPCPIWVSGERWCINLNPSNPRYQLGSVRKLIEEENIKEEYLDTDRGCLVIVHDVGYGIYEDLEVLIKDLKLEGFNVNLSSLW